MTTTTAPWWYVAALAGFFTVLGGLITVAGSLLKDRREYKRQDAARYQALIQAQSVEFVEHILNATRVAFHFRKEPYGPHAAPMYIAEAAAAQQMLIDELRLAQKNLDQFTFIVNDEVRDTARALYAYCRYLRQNLAAEPDSSILWVCT